MLSQTQAVHINRQILKSSLTRQFTRSPSRSSRKRMISLPPLEAAQKQYEKLKERNMTYHQESPREVFITIISVVRLDMLDHTRDQWIVYKYLPIYEGEGGEKVFLKQQVF